MNRLVLTLAVAALLLPVAGCAGGSSSGAAGASVAPAESQVFVSLDTSFDSSNWEDAHGLLGKFPDGDRAIASFARELGGAGADFEQDVKPALGPETDFVALDVTGEGKVVGLTQPDERAKLDALLERSHEPLVSREIAGWVAFSDSEANLDEFERLRSDGTLDADGDYQKVSGEVGEDPLAQAYISPAAFSSPEISYLEPLLGSDTPAFAFSLDPQEDGIQVEGAARPATGDLFPDEFSAELPDQVPGGAFVYVGTNGLERQLGALRDVLAEAAPGFERDIGRAEAELGVSLDEDVFPLFSAESALYIRPGFPIPEVTIVTQVDDEQKAHDTVAKLIALLKAYVGHENRSVQTVQIGDIEATEVPLEGPVSVYYATFDGKLVVTTSRKGIVDLQADGDRLADDEAFEDAIEAAGMPSETTGFVYVDLARALPLLLGVGGLGVGAEPPLWLTKNLEPLQSLVLYGERDGDLARLHGLLSIQ